MQKMKMSLRVRKLLGEGFEKALTHNKRNELSLNQRDLTYRADRNRIHLNKHWVNPRYAHIQTSEELWNMIKTDYEYAKSHKITTRKRFINRITNCRHKGQVETSIAREIIFQIGKRGDEKIVPIEIYSKFTEWLDKQFGGDVIRCDIHEDEGIRHLHIIVCTWNMQKHENYTKNSLIDNYKVFQLNAYKKVKVICENHDIRLLVPVPKNITKKEHIPTWMYEQFIVATETLKGKLIREKNIELEELKKQRKQAQEMLRSIKREIDVSKDILSQINSEINSKNKILNQISDRIKEYSDKYLIKVSEVLMKKSPKFIENILCKIEESEPNKIKKLFDEILEDKEENINVFNFKP